MKFSIIKRDGVFTNLWSHKISKFLSIILSAYIHSRLLINMKLQGYEVYNA